MTSRAGLVRAQVAWGVIYPFGSQIVHAAFAPSVDVFYYAVPFMHVHAAGMFFGYVQGVCESAVSGLQYITFATVINLVRSCYMAVSNYFTIIVWDGFGVSGVFGEGCASASRHCIVLTMALAPPSKPYLVDSGPLSEV